MSLFELTGKKAFVTGASRGIGQVIAVALAEATRTPARPRSPAP